MSSAHIIRFLFCGPTCQCILDISIYLSFVKYSETQYLTKVKLKASVTLHSELGEDATLHSVQNQDAGTRYCHRQCMMWFYSILPSLLMPQACSHSAYSNLSLRESRKFLCVHCQINVSEVGRNECAANSHPRMS